ncbi:MAG: hypothetical protein Q9170_002397 [Blastenia crenularia]
MPTTDKPESPAKRQKTTKQDPEIAQRLTHNPHIKALKQYEKILFDLEKCQALKDTVKEQDQDIKTLRDETVRLKAELVKARGSIDGLKEENNNLTRDLLKTQPSSQLSDSRIQDSYEQLYQGISAWVDTEVTTFEDEWKKIHGDDQEPKSFKYSGVNDHDVFLKCGYKLGGEYLVASILHSQLQKILFDDDSIFFALDQSQDSLMRAAEIGLRRLDPPRAPSIIRYLRSEILKGFNKSEEWTKQVSQRKPMLEKEVLEVVGTILPGIPSDRDRKERFRKKVLYPAIDFAANLKTSATVYEFDDPIMHKARFTKSVRRANELSRYIMINVDNRKVLHAADFEGDIVVEQVLFLTPGLIRRDPGKPEKRLTANTICVKVSARKAVERLGVWVSHSAVPKTIGGRSTSAEAPDALTSADTTVKPSRALSNQPQFACAVEIKEENKETSSRNKRGGLASAIEIKKEEDKEKLGSHKRGGAPNVIDLDQVEEKKFQTKRHRTEDKPLSGTNRWFHDTFESGSG